MSGFGFSASLGFSGGGLGFPSAGLSGFFSGSLGFFSGSFGFSGFFSGSLGLLGFGGGGSTISMLLMDPQPLQQSLSRIFSGLQQTTVMVTLFVFSS